MLAEGLGGKSSAFLIVCCVAHFSELAIMVSVYIYDLNKLDNNEEYEMRYANASIERRKDKLNLGVSAVLDEALKQFGLREKMVRMHKTEYGKPYLTDYNDIYYNISHSGRYVMCGISNSEIGVDIERTDKMRLNVAKRYFCESEYEHIVSMDTDEMKREMFYRYWVLKESFVKAVGKGVSIPFSSFEFSISDNEETAPVVSQLIDDNKYIFKEFSLNGYRAAVCATEEPRGITYI